MKISTRNKAIRHLVSTIISGVFSENEINEIIKALVNSDQSFTRDLGLSLKEVARIISIPIPATVSSNSQRKEIPEKTNELAILIDKWSLPIRDLVRLIADVVPNPKVYSSKKNLSKSKLHDVILNNETQEMQEILIHEIARVIRASTQGKDSYLELISERLKP